MKDVEEGSDKAHGQSGGRDSDVVWDSDWIVAVRRFGSLHRRGGSTGSRLGYRGNIDYVGHVDNLDYGRG